MKNLCDMTRSTLSRIFFGQRGLKRAKRFSTGAAEEVLARAGVGAGGGGMIAEDAPIAESRASWMCERLPVCEICCDAAQRGGMLLGIQGALAGGADEGGW